MNSKSSKSKSIPKVNQIKLIEANSGYQLEQLVNEHIHQLSSSPRTKSLYILDIQYSGTNAMIKMYISYHSSKKINNNNLSEQIELVQAEGINKIRVIEEKYIHNIEPEVNALLKLIRKNPSTKYDLLYPKDNMVVINITESVVDGIRGRKDNYRYEHDGPAIGFRSSDYRMYNNSSC